MSRETSPSSSCNALIVMAHGSPRPIANADMLRVVDLIRERGQYSIVQAAFLECNVPSIPDSIDACVEAGATVITAVPYFLHTGTHVADDLPGLLEAARRRHPAVHFLLGPYLGRSPQLTDILADRTRSAQSRSR
jgi:sirohydrochlorin ferrochelatase